MPKLRCIRIRVACERLSGLQGQRVVVDEAANLLFHWIQEGPYLTAGRKFGWKGAGWGVNEAILSLMLKNGYKLCIISARKFDRYYRTKLDAKSLIDLALKHKAIEYKGRVKIYIIPFTRDYFETVTDPNTVREVVRLFEAT